MTGYMMVVVGLVLLISGETASEPLTLEEEVLELQSYVAEQRALKARLSQLLMQAAGTNSSQQQRMNTAPKPGTSMGAFSASRSTNVALPAGGVVVFDTVYVNSEGDYYQGTGTYICPLDGTYVFSVQIYGVTAARVVSLMKEGVQQMQVYSGVLASQTGSGWAVIHCTLSEAVYVTVQGAGTIGGSAYSHFSGYLLHADPLKTRSGRVESRATTAIGSFNAIRTSNINININGRLVFNQATYNPYGDYDASSGIYTCPFNGTYVFQVKLRTNTYVSSLRLRKAGVQQMLLYSLANMQTSGTSVFTCTESQAVDVTAVGGTAYIYGGFTHFSGHLIHIDPVEPNSRA